MWYIVYRNKHKSTILGSASKETGVGYYVGYKNKLEDNFSSNFIEAKRYKSIGPALTRLGVNYIPGMSMEKLLSTIKTNNTQAKREDILNKVFDIETKYNPIDILFTNGRIEILSDDGKLIGSAGEDITKYIESKFVDKSNQIKSKELDKFDYITEGNDDSFWDEKNW